MNKTILKTLLLSFCISIFALGKSYALDQAAFLASSVYQNSETGYTAYIDDEEDLLSSSEEESLRKQLISLTEYGNVAFLSGRGEYSAASTIRNFYNTVFSGKSGLIFFIDMENREIRIESGGTFYRTITTNVANSITDNVYRFAGDGDYYKTASLAFSQVEDALLRPRCAGSVIFFWQYSWDYCLTSASYFSHGSRIRQVLARFSECFTRILSWKTKK